MSTSLNKYINNLVISFVKVALQIQTLDGVVEKRKSVGNTRSIEMARAHVQNLAGRAVAAKTSSGKNDSANENAVCHSNVPNHPSPPHTHKHKTTQKQ